MCNHGSEKLVVLLDAEKSHIAISIYLWSKVVCFVLYRWDPPNWDASDCVLGLFVKLSWGGGGGGGGLGCIGLVSWCLDLQCKSSWILNDFFAENLGGIIGMCLRVFLEKDLDEQRFNGIYLVRFGFRM